MFTIIAFSGLRTVAEAYVGSVYLGGHFLNAELGAG
jgi:hypothetical protein